MVGWNCQGGNSLENLQQQKTFVGSNSKEGSGILSMYCVVSGLGGGLIEWNNVCN